MDKRTARRLVAATAFTVPGAIGAAHANATFLTPRANTAVGGKAVTIYAQFTAPRPVAAVRLFLDDSLLGERTFKPGGTSGSVNFAWDSTVATGGSHRVSLKMYDRSGKLIGTQAIPISVVNGGSVDTVPPQVTIIAPAPESAVRGTFDVRVLATDNSGEAPYVSLFVDKELRSVSNRQPYSITVDTTQYPNGNHVLEAWAFDAASNKATATPVPFRVNNPGGATTLNTEVNSATPAPTAETPRPTADAVIAVPQPEAAAATTPVAAAPVVKPPSKARPAAVKPAVTSIAKPRPVAKAAVAPKHKDLVAALPQVPVQDVLEAAPAPSDIQVVESAAIRELPVEAPAPEVPFVDVAPAPVVKPVATTSVSHPAPKPVAMKHAAKSVEAKPAPKVTAEEPKVAPVDESPVYVLKMRGDKVLEQSPAAKPMVQTHKTLVAKALPVEGGNPVSLPKHIASLPRTTAPIVKAHSNPAPLKVAAAPVRIKHDLKPVIVPTLPSDRVKGGRIIHAVRPGETPERVARAYGVPVKRLLASNHLGRRGQFALGETIAVPSPVRIALNDLPIQFDVAPRIQNGVTTAALRQICEAAGGQVDWDAKTKEVRATSGATEIVLRIGSRFATVNGQRVALDTIAAVYGGRTLVPVKFLTDALKLHAEYDLRSGEISLHRA